MQQIDTVDYLIEKQHNSYLASKNQLFSDYMKRISHPHTHNVLVSCTGWESLSSAESLLRLLSPAVTSKQQGGYFVRYNGTGLCINPGAHFFERFTEAGFHLWEIDVVIVTSEHAEASCDVPLLYELNRELNTTLLSYEQEPHVIRYLLHPKTYSRFATELRPHFREERDTVISLETFDGEEMVVVSEDIALHYASAKNGALQLRLTGKKICIGYSSSGGSDSLPFFTPCDLLIMAPEEIFPVSQMQKLKLILLSEFSAKEGDTRLESAKKFAAKQLAVLPFDAGVVIDLDALGVNVKDTSPWHFIPYQEITVVRVRDFAKLLYLSKDQLL